LGLCGIVFANRIFDLKRYNIFLVMTPPLIESNHFSLAYKARTSLVDPLHEAAFRLFNGFLEGDPDLVMDVYGRTLLVYNYTEIPNKANPIIQSAIQVAMEAFPWITSVVLKIRSSQLPQERQGILVMGSHIDHKIREHGVWYALDLLMNQDASFYMDTRNLRSWAKNNLGGKNVLNTFAYTGSLGIAALAGGAAQVVQLDLSRKFLNLAKISCSLNGFAIKPSDFIVGNFLTEINELKRQDTLFDCIFLDPPFFSTTPRGGIDLVNQGYRVINKVRPLINDGGWLVSINNALFLSGAEYLKQLQRLCADGNLSIEELIPVPDDIIGFPHTLRASLPTDPFPFNHSTKIAILRVRRKYVA
jgi:23S rRNA (cytosine1962-C5)-methyltransferase